MASGTLLFEPVAVDDPVVEQRKPRYPIGVNVLIGLGVIESPKQSQWVVIRGDDEICSVNVCFQC